MFSGFRFAALATAVSEASAAYGYKSLKPRTAYSSLAVRRAAAGQQSVGLSGDCPDARPLSDKPPYNKIGQYKPD
jgi:hypothetical protein